MKGKPVGWKNDSYRHSLASHGIRTAGRRRVMKRRVIPFQYGETSGAWQDEFGIDLKRLGYHYPEDWESDDVGLVIHNPLMLEDPDVISLLGEHGILTEDQQSPVTDRLGKDYYVDERSKQLRNVYNPHDIISLGWYDNREIRETVNSALTHGMGMELTVMKRGEVGTVILEQHPNYRTALYPDVYGRETPDWIFKDLENILGSGNVHTSADGVMEHIIAPIRGKGYTIYSEED